MGRPRHGDAHDDATHYLPLSVVFGDWITGQRPAPPTWLRDDHAEVRAFMLDYLSHVRAQTARSGPNRGKPLSALRVNDIITDVEKFYAHMTDYRETAARVLEEPAWLRLTPFHAILWRHGRRATRGPA